MPVSSIAAALVLGDKPHPRRRLDESLDTRLEKGSAHPLAGAGLDRIGYPDVPLPIGYGVMMHASGAREIDASPAKEGSGCANL